MVHLRLEELEKYALENNVPIMQKDGIDFLTNYIKENNIKSILEIGSAIGYSAINWALVDEKIHITTIEIDKDRYIEAIDNVKSFEVEDQIDLVFNDAMNVNVQDKYDIIIIDAAKGKNEAFFERLE